MRTLPSNNKVAVRPPLAVDMLLVASNVPVSGSYSSALAVTLPPLLPPAKSTFPLRKRVAVWAFRAMAILPVTAKLPVAGSYSSALESSSSLSSDQQHSVRVSLGRRSLRRVVGPAGNKHLPTRQQRLRGKLPSCMVAHAGGWREPPGCGVVELGTCIGSPE